MKPGEVLNMSYLLRENFFNLLKKEGIEGLWGV